MSLELGVNEEGLDDPEAPHETEAAEPEDPEESKLIEACITERCCEVSRQYQKRKHSGARGGEFDVSV